MSEVETLVPDLTERERRQHRRLAVGNRRVCCTCHQLKEIEDFVVDDAGRRRMDDECVDCRELEHIPEEKTVTQAKKAALKTIISVLRGTHLASPHPSVFATQMMHCFGGVKNFSQAWHQQLEVAITKDPGSARVLNAFRDIGKMMIESHKHRDSAPDFSDVSDEDLDRVIEHELRNIGTIDLDESMPLLEFDEEELARG